MFSIRKWIRKHRMIILFAVIKLLLIFSYKYYINYYNLNFVPTADNRTTYVCSDNKCTTIMSLENKNVKFKTFRTMETCRLICGTTGNLWPKPLPPVKLGNNLIPIDPRNIKLTIQGSDEVQEFLIQAFYIMKYNLITECRGRNIAPSKTLIIAIDVQENEVELNSKTNESYEMNIVYILDQLKVVIFATSAFGARHGMETATQLTTREFWSPLCQVFMLDHAEIKDSPQFRHRGILIDTSRHFIPIQDLENTVSAMAANKLNVLHWHATDSHSFPLQLRSVEYLARYGAYSVEEVYTEEMIIHLVNFAKHRGVRILLEIDTPAHAGNGWQFGKKQNKGDLVLCRNYTPWKSRCYQPPCGQLNPANNYTYKVLTDLYKNLWNLIPYDEMFHMGGDEVNYNCWSNTEEVEKYMESHDYPWDDSRLLQLWAEFHNRSVESWDSAVGHSNTKIVLWSSRLTHPELITKFLDKDRYIIQVWTESVDMLPIQLIELGYEVIFSTVDTWYLDHGFYDSSRYHDWIQVYSNIISDHGNVLGGEAALWTEYVDVNSLDNRLWPRASALAERLWSNAPTSPINVIYRLAEMRERLIRRGFKVDQIMSQWCYLNEGRC